MARTRGGKRFNSKTSLTAQGSINQFGKDSPTNHKSKSPYVCSTCSKGYVLRDSFLAHTLIHTRERLRNLKPKRQHQRELRPTCSLSSPTIPAASEAELGRSLEDQSSLSSSPSLTLAATATATTQDHSLSKSSSLDSSSWIALDTHLEDEKEFARTTSTNLSWTTEDPKSASLRPKDSACVTDVTIPDPSGPKILKRQVSNSNEAEPIIIISDDEEDSVTETTRKTHANYTHEEDLVTETTPETGGKYTNEEDSVTETTPETAENYTHEEDSVTETTPEIGGNFTHKKDLVTESMQETYGNYTRFMSTPSVSTSHLDEKEREYSDYAMYTTPPKAPIFLYENSGTSENISHSYPLPKAEMSHVSHSDTTVVISDDDEPMTIMKTGSSKKKNVAKRLFSDLPLRQNQIRNGGFDSMDFKSGELNSRGNVKEALDKINQLGPIITLTKTKTTRDISNNTTKEAFDKIRQLGPAVSFTRATD